MFNIGSSFFFLNINSSSCRYTCTVYVCSLALCKLQHTHFCKYVGKNNKEYVLITVFIEHVLI